MTVIRVEIEPHTGLVRLMWPYEPTLVELIKTIPGGRRTWDSHNKAWRLDRHSDAIDFVNTAAGLGHTIVGDERIVGSQRSSPTPCADGSAVPTAFFEQLFDIVGPSREEPLYRAMVKVLHPDTETGSTELMQALNAARDRMGVYR